MEDLALSLHDLYFVHCHQIVPKSQEAVFKQLLRESMAFNSENPIGIRSKSTANALPRHAPHRMVTYETGISIDMEHSGHFSIDPSPAPPPPRAQFEAFAVDRSPMNGLNPFDSPFSFHPNVISQRSNRALIGGREVDENGNGRNGSGSISDRTRNGMASSSPLLSPRPHPMVNVAPSSALRVSYDCIPQHIDGGLLSSGIFLPYKQWCESSIIRHTEQAGECLDQMKKESNVLAALHRNKTLSETRGHSLYADTDNDSDTETVDGAETGGGGGGGAFLDEDDGDDDDDDGTYFVNGN